MYCSLSEVWGNDFNKQQSYNDRNNDMNYNRNDRNDRNNDRNDKNNDMNDRNNDKKMNDIINNNIIEHFTDKNISCENFLNHIVDCVHCQKKLTDNFCKKNILSMFNLKDIDKNTKDTIIIFIIGIIIIIFLKILLD